MILPNGPCLGVPAPEQPGMGPPLRASAIVEALEETLVARNGTGVDDFLFAAVRHDLRRILDFQSAIRGLPQPSRSIWYVRMAVDQRGALVVTCGPDWLPAVDRHLRNADCRRCGGLRTSGFVHTMTDCDDILARLVLES